MKTLARELGLPEIGVAATLCVLALLVAMCVPSRFGDEAMAGVFLVDLVAWTLASRECRLVWALSFFSYCAIRAHQPHFIASLSCSVTPLCVGRLAHALYALVR